MPTTYSEAWAVDFEYKSDAGERPVPTCMVALELVSGAAVRLGAAELGSLDRAPFNTGDNVLFTCFFAPAELGCFLALGWPLPANVVDLFAEHRVATNGLETPGNSLLATLRWHGLAGITAAEKIGMRALAMRGGPYTDAEMESLLDYCESDVRALVELWPKMLPTIDLPRALLRGRYMAAVAKMEHAGIPIDVETLGRLRTHWEAVKLRLIAEVDQGFGFYDGKTFKLDRFGSWLAERRYDWPRTDCGRLAVDKDTFKDQAAIHPELEPLRQLRTSVGQMNLFDLGVGADGRARCMLSPLAAKTGRNAPSTAGFVFGLSGWLRSVIKPAEGRALAYVDWGQQELGIAGALSGDPALMAAYRSGDPYLAFAVQAGLAPADATKQSHGAVRDLCKAAVLGVNYGMSAQSLASRIRRPTAYAQDLLDRHREAYPVFWKWSEAVVDHAILNRSIHSTHGWTLHVRGEPNPRSLMNWPMQAAGAEMLRLACILATEAGISVVAPVHDALLVEGPTKSIQEVVSATRDAMARASRLVLDGFDLTTDAETITYPERYRSEKGGALWGSVTAILDDLDGVPPCTPGTVSVRAGDG
ncbi:DNA polymerase I, thermostable [Pirellulimonas nuda]|uniref:DNA-directed DNA polymerase n=1 Tax=Pirellulimonas nuda TaxID=2528009 RepID=A0A518DG96_9BACT|nr:DNA polymerase [Pirellulimonas nuda]QDU90501.1 DNA polymerase I, thermostable [Pirellulimonas nuda]